MNECGSGSWMGICEPSLALSIVSGSQTDALVSDYSSKSKSSTGQKARWQAPAAEWPARRSFALSIAQPRGKREHLSTLSTLLRELVDSGICLLPAESRLEFTGDPAGSNRDCDRMAAKPEVVLNPGWADQTRRQARK
jgi:hypothetical protein